MLAIGERVRLMQEIMGLYETVDRPKGSVEN
jgi:hypothetical protein